MKTNVTEGGGCCTPEAELIGWVSVTRHQKSHNFADVICEESLGARGLRHDVDGVELGSLLHRADLSVRPVRQLGLGNQLEAYSAPPGNVERFQKYLLFVYMLSDIAVSFKTQPSVIFDRGLSV